MANTAPATTATPAAAVTNDAHPAKKTVAIAIDDATTTETSTGLCQDIFSLCVKL